jgi:hypothetical protein
MAIVFHKPAREMTRAEIDELMTYSKRIVRHTGPKSKHPEIDIMTTIVGLATLDRSAINVKLQYEIDPDGLTKEALKRFCQWLDRLQEIALMTKEGCFGDNPPMVSDALLDPAIAPAIERWITHRDMHNAVKEMLGRWISFAAELRDKRK